MHPSSPQGRYPDRTQSCRMNQQHGRTRAKAVPPQYPKRYKARLFSRCKTRPPGHLSATPQTTSFSASSYLKLRIDTK